MINRKLIRIKIVQLVYAYYQNGSKNLDSAEKDLLLSLSKAYQLYNYLLLLIVAITKEEAHRVSIGMQRAKREGMEEPSEKFVENRFAAQLADNKMLNKFVEMQHLSWDDSIEFVRKMCSLIEQSDIYAEYMQSEVSSYEADKELWRKIYKQFIQDNTDLDSLLEEKSIYWNDDKEVVDTFVIKTIKRFEEKAQADQVLLEEYKDEDDREFAIRLFRATILNQEQYHRYMSETSRNWDFSRLAYMDVIIMQIAIAEMMTFPNIPISVTINEYVELAKFYSTPKSGSYINGMLDAIARHLIKSNMLLKSIDDRKAKTPKGEANEDNTDI